MSQQLGLKEGWILGGGEVAEQLIVCMFLQRVGDEWGAPGVTHTNSTPQFSVFPLSSSLEYKMNMSREP